MKTQSSTLLFANTPTGDAGVVKSARQSNSSIDKRHHNLHNVNKYISANSSKAGLVYLNDRSLCQARQLRQDKLIRGSISNFTTIINKDKLPEYIKKEHCEEKLKCKICEEEVSVKSMERHLKRCSSDKPRPLKCSVNYCESVFKTVADRRSHVQKFHAEMFECPSPNCYRKFNKSGLLPHVVRVHKKMTNTCSKCNKTMTFINLSKHINTCKNKRGRPRKYSLNSDLKKNVYLPNCVVMLEKLSLKHIFKSANDYGEQGTKKKIKVRNSSRNTRSPGQLDQEISMKIQNISLERQVRFKKPHQREQETKKEINVRNSLRNTRSSRQFVLEISMEIPKLSLEMQITRRKRRERLEQNINIENEEISVETDLQSFSCNNSVDMQPITIAANISPAANEVSKDSGFTDDEFSFHLSDDEDWSDEVEITKVLNYAENYYWP